MTTPTLRDTDPVALAPEWLSHRYDPTHDAFHYRIVPRAQRATAPFLTDAELGEDSNPIIIERKRCGLAEAPAPIHFILHSAYCCSTLLANGYDRPGTAFSLKEPVVLNDLVGWRQRGADPAQLQTVLDSALAQCARPFAPGEACIVKPSNIVNGLAPAMLRLRPNARAVLLYAPLDRYLGSIAQKQLWGRLWVRTLLASFLKDGLVKLGFTAEDIFLQSDLQVAAVGWLVQQALFAQIAEVWPERIRTLDSETLVADPAAALAAIDRLFDVPAEPEHRAAIVATVFKQHAKSGAAFDAAARHADQRSAASLHAEELAMVGSWARTVAANAGLSLDLPLPLVGTGQSAI